MLLNQSELGDVFSPFYRLSKHILGKQKGLTEYIQSHLKWGAGQDIRVSLTSDENGRLGISEMDGLLCHILTFRAPREFMQSEIICTLRRNGEKDLVVRPNL